MSDNALFFRQQAIKQRADASEAVLGNVRERCERAAASWEAMAARAELTASLRADREARTGAPSVADAPAAGPDDRAG